MTQRPFRMQQRCDARLATAATRQQAPRLRWGGKSWRSHFGCVDPFTSHAPPQPLFTRRAMPQCVSASAIATACVCDQEAADRSAPGCMCWPPLKTIPSRRRAVKRGGRPLARWASAGAGSASQEPQRWCLTASEAKAAATAPPHRPSGAHGRNASQPPSVSSPGTPSAIHGQLSTACPQLLPRPPTASILI